MYRNHTVCRACSLGKPESPTLKHSTAAGDIYDKPAALSGALDLGLQPLANDFAEATEGHSGFAPLKVMFCPRCTLAQLSVVVDPSILYRHYAYVTSHGKTMLDHFEQIRSDMLAECTQLHRVLEVGSNDGTLLSFLKNNPFEEVYGMDPAANLVKIANQNGIQSEASFFSTATLSDFPAYDLIVARHVMCHIDDWQDFVRALDMVSHKETLVCIEVPYAQDMIEEGSFDQIYHEHLSYMTVRAMECLLRGSAFHLHRVNHYAIHGGAIMLMLRRDGCPQPPHTSVQDYLRKETFSIDSWQGLASKSELLAMELGALVRDLATKGKKVVGYGASAKSSVWLNACHFTKREVLFVCDETPTKQYKLCPGTDIPVVDPGALSRELPDAAILFAWNFKEECLAKEQLFRAKGGKWIIPLPKIEVI